SDGLKASPWMTVRFSCATSNFDGVRTNAVTPKPFSAACFTTSRPTPPVTPKIIIFMAFPPLLLTCCFCLLIQGLKPCFFWCAVLFAICINQKLNELAICLPSLRRIHDELVLMTEFRFVLRIKDVDDFDPAALQFSRHFQSLFFK